MTPVHTLSCSFQPIELRARFFIAEIAHHENVLFYASQKEDGTWFAIVSTPSGSTGRSGPTAEAAAAAAVGAHAELIAEHGLPRAKQLKAKASLDIDLNDLEIDL